MRRPALYRPDPAGTWARPYAGVLAHAVFYRSGDPANPPAPPAPNPPAPPAPAPPAPPEPGNTPPVPAPPTNPQLVSYTQADLNTLMAREKEQGRRSALRAIATEAGMDPDQVDLTQVGSLLKQAQEASRARMTELERREADAKAAEERAARETQAANERARHADFQIALLGLGAAPTGLGDVCALLRNDLASAGITDPTPEQISEYAGKLKERRPTDFAAPAVPAAAQQTPPPAPGGAPAAGGQPRVPATKDDIKARARARAEQMGLAKPVAKPA
jgi:hypothetical protein